ncbi:type II toxin-antitoxin system RnlA family toxin [Balnearium lithotrophicum]|uniref:type II toxin-antitoxin system RnlA family toxin n=1 Tax=Balnearium lithotrophicum TaxID=223788 RepID=UPI00163D6F2B|nr:type II toxin-antitoxin system RnlA family toxin [Balnearium lithotrophicum]
MNLTEKELDEILKELESLKGAQIEKGFTKGKSLKIKITLPGQKPALILVWFKQDGATIQYNIGKNPSLSEQIAQQIVDRCGYLQDVNEPLDGVTQELFDDFQRYLKDTGITIEKIENRDYEVLLKLSWHSGQQLTVHYYPQKSRLYITGKKNRIFDEICMWYANASSKSPIEVIKLIFSNYAQIQGVEEKFPDNIVEKEVTKQLGNAYHNLDDQEKRWLKTSVYMTTLHKDLPDFYPSISCSLKAVEGILKRIFVKKCIFSALDKNKKFTQFRNENGKYVLKEEFCNSFTDSQVQAIEKTYQFIVDRRHKLQHAEFKWSIFLNREDAESILNEVYEVIKNLNQVGLL